MIWYDMKPPPVQDLPCRTVPLNSQIKMLDSQYIPNFVVWRAKRECGPICTLTNAQSTSRAENLLPTKCSYPSIQHLAVHIKISVWWFVTKRVRQTYRRMLEDIINYGQYSKILIIERLPPWIGPGYHDSLIQSAISLIPSLSPLIDWFLWIVVNYLTLPSCLPLIMSTSHIL